MLTLLLKIIHFLNNIFVEKVNDNQYNRHRPLTNLDFGIKTVKIRCNFPKY